MNNNFNKYDYATIAKLITPFENLIDNKYLVCDLMDATNQVYKNLDEYYEIPHIKTFCEVNNHALGYHNAKKGICITNLGIKNPLGDLIHTILHEYRHNVQWNAVLNINSLSGDERTFAELYQINFKCYKGGSGGQKNYIIYYFQPIEEEANLYAYDIFAAYLSTKTDPKYNELEKTLNRGLEQYDACVMTARAIFGDNYKEEIWKEIFKR